MIKPILAALLAILPLLPYPSASFPEVLSSGSLRSQAISRGGYLDNLGHCPSAKNQKPSLQPGLLLRLQSVASPKAFDTQRSRLAALYVPDQTPASPFIPQGPFTARFQGFLTLPLRTKLTFSAEGSGSIRLTIKGKTILEGTAEDLSTLETVARRIRKGNNPFTLEYTSPKTGPAQLRLLWQGKDFVAEPVPASAFLHDSTDEELLAMNAVHQGREHFATLRCTQCHALPGSPSSESVEPMPELSARSPSLHNITSRLRPEWIAQWIQNPHAQRATARMPALLSHSSLELAAKSNDSTAIDIVAYLQTQATSKAPTPPPFKTPPGPNDSHSKGADLFHHLGCIGCHELPEIIPSSHPASKLPNPERIPHDRISLSHINQKFQPGALASFLQNPTTHYPSTRMPHFGLSVSEAKHLANFLRSKTIWSEELTSTATLAGDPTRGREAFTKHRCTSCHDLTPPTPTLPKHPNASGNTTGNTTGNASDNTSSNQADTTTAPPLLTLLKTPWIKGCLPSTHTVSSATSPKAPDSPKPSPYYPITQSTHTKLETFRKHTLHSLTHSPKTSLSRTTPSLFTTRSLSTLHCTTCHSLDQTPDLLSTRATLTKHLSLPHKNLLSQLRPSLTNAGEKLHTSFTRQLFSGTLPQKTRPYILSRMPAFPHHAPYLSPGLSHIHGLPESSPTPPPTKDSALLTPGNLLISTDGFSCNACHPIATTPPFATFEFGAPNLSLATSRIRAPYYTRWMWDPPRLEPTSRMPIYASPEDNESLQDEILDGNATKQFKAIWHALHHLPKLK